MNEIFLNNFIKLDTYDAQLATDNSLTKLGQWWVFNGNEILFGNKGQPMCNKNPDIARTMAKNLGLDIIYIPVVYIPDRIWMKGY